MNLSWTERIYTKHGFVTEDVVQGISALDLGCGGRKLPGATGVDALALPGVDVVHDLEIRPWPFADEAFDLVFANHFLEHTEDVLATLGEAHRILKPGGRLVIQVPYFRSTDAVSDPTHRHLFTSASLDYVIKGTKLEKYSYTPFKFTRIGFWYGWPQRSRNPLVRRFKTYLNTHKSFYDQRLSLLVPTECVTWELEKVS
jgi:SAM-dependent methyltransferase